MAATSYPRIVVSYVKNVSKFQYIMWWKYYWYLNTIIVEDTEWDEQYLCEGKTHSVMDIILWVCIVGKESKNHALHTIFVHTLNK